MPDGWYHEKTFADKTIKIINGEDRFFLSNYKKNRLFRDTDIEDFNMVGCKTFKANVKMSEKNSRNFYTDLYLFTADQLHEDPSFWGCYILWSKTTFLKDAIELMYYTGQNTKAFIGMTAPRPACTGAGVAMQAEIFPESIAPDFFTIAADFRDDAFFLEFLEMPNAMNPS